ncbi:GNAT family N-acetyltransferase, partial [Cellulomonas hominis]|nr:GNAT family N-acetyltransferase [Cellulomonas hominis]
VQAAAAEHAQQRVALPDAARDQVLDEVRLVPQPLGPGAVLAVTEDGPVGFAHARRFPRPILGAEGVYLDDLYTSPSARGRGVARALLGELAAQARAEGLGVVRWTTRPGNAAARRLYDAVATVADSVTYDLVPAEAADPVR